MSLFGLKSFNIGDLVDLGLKLLTEKEKLLTNPSYLMGLNSQINQQVESLTDLSRNLGALFQKPYGADNNNPYTITTYDFQNEYPVISAGYGLTINGKELGAERLVFINDLTINQGIGTDTCDFTVSDPNFYFIEDNIYKRDTPIQASITLLGTSEVNNYTRIYFDGYIAVVDIDFPVDGSPTLKVSCVDKATHLMTRKKWRRSWENVTSAQVVSIIAQELGFKCYVEPDYTFPVQSTITQDGKTNIEFLEELAESELDLFVLNPVVNMDGSIILYYVIKGHLNEEFYFSLGYRMTSGRDETDPKKIMNYDIMSFSPRINIETRKEEEQTDGINMNTKEAESYSEPIDDVVYPESSNMDIGSDESNGSDSGSSDYGGDDRVYTNYGY